MKKKNGNEMTEMKEFAVIQCGEYPDKIDFLVAENVGDGEFIQCLNEGSMKKIVSKFVKRFEDEECRSLCERLKKVPFIKVLYRTSNEAVAYGVRAKFENKAEKAIKEVIETLKNLKDEDCDYSDEFSKRKAKIGKYLVFLINTGIPEGVDDKYWGDGYGKIVCETKDLFILEGGKGVDRNNDFFFFKIVDTEEEALRYYSDIDEIILGYGISCISVFHNMFNDRLKDKIEEYAETA